MLLKDYADNLDKMTPAKAKALAEKSFALQQQKTDLKRKFFAEFEKAQPANRVAKFFQVDHRLDLLVLLRRDHHAFDGHTAVTDTLDNCFHRKISPQRKNFPAGFQPPEIIRHQEGSPTAALTSSMVFSAMARA